MSGFGNTRFAVLGTLLAALLVTAPGCLKKQNGDPTAEEDEGKSFIVGRWAFKRLNTAEAALADNDVATAKATLAEMQKNDELNPHEQALMWQMLGGIYANEQNYPEALKAFEKCMELDALPSASQRSVEFNLGQLYAITGNYKRATELLEAWLAKEKTKPTREIQLMLANSYVQLGEYEKALPYAEAVAADNEQPDESVLQLLLAIRVQLKQHDKAIELLTQLVERFPKKTYWLQLSAAYGQVGDERRALAVLELAYRQGLLDQETELLSLVQHYLAMSLPLEAAQVLDKELKAGRISASAKNYELLANSWMAARQTDQALTALGQAAQKSETGEPYLRLAQLQMQREHWSEARSAIERAIQKGQLSDPATAQLLLGNISYELGQRAAAREAFQRAARDEQQRAAANRWLDMMRREDESCPTGKEAACKLIPGRSR